MPEEEIGAPRPKGGKPEAKINITEYGYSQETKTEIQGNVLLALLNFTNEVLSRESHEVLLFELPEKNGEWKVATTKDFFEQKTRPATTELGAKAMDLQYILESIHYENIQNNIAIKNEEIGAFQV